MEGGGFEKARGLKWVVGFEKGCLENCSGIGEVGWHRRLGFW